MDSNDLRKRYIQFFEQRGHRYIPSASLLPENDPTVLFTTAGMHPLVPFLLGEPHPQGKRLVGFQKCLRTNDIDEVGDTSHLTFFEMLGNWSLGDYFKEESLSWSYEFLTRQLGIDPNHLAVTVFAGDTDAPRDEISAGIWRRLGIRQEQIFFLPKEDNWWGPAGKTGPCGPDSEIFYDTGRPDHPGCQPGCKCGKWLEIWNNVFMEYDKHADGSFTRLKRSNVDTGMGMERTVAALKGYDDVFRIETLFPLIQAIEGIAGKKYEDNPAPFRVIADHIRAATFAIADGALPSNVEAGYVTRRLIRRTVENARKLGIRDPFCAVLSGEVIDLYCAVYPDLEKKRAFVAETLELEVQDYSRAIERGTRQFEKIAARVRKEGKTQISGKDAFFLFDTHGLPISRTIELAQEQGLSVDVPGFEEEITRQRDRSHDAQDGNFTGGLADHSVESTRLHTASHLLQAALRQVLGPHVHQMGSHITPERLRFDFAHTARLTDEELAEVERLVNEQIARDLPVTMEIMPLDQAVQNGALAFFGEKYGDQVKVYTIGDFSKEVCGGPHVSHTGELGHFKITKQESVGAGIRRIRAVLEE